MSSKTARRTRRRGRSRTVRLVFRFLTGRSLDGKRHSNATFWRRGTRRLGYPPYFITWDRWALAAGWQRAVLRLVAVAVVLAVGAVVVL
jgi:hypothetical protein